MGSGAEPQVEAMGGQKRRWVCVRWGCGWGHTTDLHGGGEGPEPKARGASESVGPWLDSL